MAIDLGKKTAAAGIVLAKRNLPNPPACEVGVALDISGSMRDEYQDNIVQDVAERIFALSMRFDKDQKLDVWTYDDREPSYIGSVVVSNVEDYVKKNIVNNSSINKWGGTDYAPVLKMIDTHYFGGTTVKESSGFLGMFKKKTVETSGGASGGAPVLLFFITDGENSDRREFESTMQGLRSKNIYVQIVGVGNANLSYVERVANAEPNVGFCQIRDVRALSDEQMMEKIVTTEFVDWIKKF